MESTMRLRTGIAAFVLVAGALLWAAPARAHHSIANFWDGSKDISVSGVIKAVKLVNPHSELTLEVMEDGKPVKWLAFGLGITDLRRRGITNEMLLNKDVTFKGNPPKPAARKGILLHAIDVGDGKRTQLIH